MSPFSSNSHSNWYGAYVLYCKEVRRFLRVYNQTIFAPVVSALTFLIIFILAIRPENQDNNQHFLQFMSCGLIIMTMMQNAFANSSSSILTAKVLGYITDILIPPLGAWEILFAYVLSAITRGLIVGTIIFLIVQPFAHLQLYHWYTCLFFSLNSCILLSLIGLICGLTASNFEQGAAFTSYVVTPLSFLSCTFFSIERLPQLLQKLTLINPLFYAIDGFRYSFTNQADGNILTGAIVILGTNLILYFAVGLLINTGWRLKN